jgi:hypothetical protein
VLLLHCAFHDSRELQQSKAQTIAGVLSEEGFARSLTTTDLEYLFAED